jgi:ABC-2 type transport system ATP-binding protein
MPPWRSIGPPRPGEHTAVDNLSLQVPSNTIYGFIGPNGSGKTTTRMIMAFSSGFGPHPSSGRETWHAASDRVAYLPEERGLYKKMKVREILRFYAELKGCRDCQTAIDDWLAK